MLLGGEHVGRRVDRHCGFYFRIYRTPHRAWHIIDMQQIVVESTKYPTRKWSQMPHVHQIEEWLLFAPSGIAVVYLFCFLADTICRKFGERKNTQKKIKGTCNPFMHRQTLFLSSSACLTWKSEHFLLSINLSSKTWFLKTQIVHWVDTQYLFFAFSPISLPCPGRPDSPSPWHSLHCGGPGADMWPVRTISCFWIFYTLFLYSISPP